MKYLKVWVNFREALEPYSDAEKGRLFDAMLAYAGDGTEPHFSGNERYLWGAAKQTIDLTRETSEKRKTSGSAGGTATAENRETATDSKPQQNIANGSKTEQTVASISSKEKKRNEKKGNEKRFDDDDDDGDVITREQEDLRYAIRRAFPTFCGRNATPAEADLISVRAHGLGFSPPMAVRAIEEAAKNGAKNIQAYTAAIFEQWDYEGIKTPEEADELKVLMDGANGKSPFLDPQRCEEEMEENRRRRKAGGE